MNKENKYISESFFNEKFSNFNFVFENKNTIVFDEENMT